MSLTHPTQWPEAPSNGSAALDRQAAGRGRRGWRFPTGSAIGSSNTIHLVMGASSVGKSSYILSKIADHGWAELPIFMACELKSRWDEDPCVGECVVHYNLLRPYWNRAGIPESHLPTDAVLVSLLRQPERVRAHLLIAARSEVARRCLARTRIEPDLRGTDNPYPSQQVLELLRCLDWSTFHRLWFDLLTAYRIQFQILHSTGDAFTPISPGAAASLLQQG